MNIQVLLLLVTVLYVAQSIAYFVTGNPAKGIVIMGYVLANCGLMWVK